MLLIALMADITMLLEIPMKVRKSRTPPWGLPHSLLLEKYFWFSFVFFHKSNSYLSLGLFSAARQPRGIMTERSLTECVTISVLSTNCDLTLTVVTSPPLPVSHSHSTGGRRTGQTWSAQQREPAGARTAVRRAWWWTTSPQWSPWPRYWSVASQSTPGICCNR